MRISRYIVATAYLSVAAALTYSILFYLVG